MRRKVVFRLVPDLELLPCKRFRREGFEAACPGKFFFHLLVEQQERLVFRACEVERRGGGADEFCDVGAAVRHLHGADMVADARHDVAEWDDGSAFRDLLRRLFRREAGRELPERVEARAVAGERWEPEPWECCLRAVDLVDEALCEDASGVCRTVVGHLPHADGGEVEAAVNAGALSAVDGVRQLFFEPALVVKARDGLGVGDAGDFGEMVPADAQDEQDAGEQCQENQNEDAEALDRVTVEVRDEGSLFRRRAGFLVDVALDGAGVEVRDFLVEDAHEDGIDALADGDARALRVDDGVVGFEAEETVPIDERLRDDALDGGDVGLAFADGAQAVFVCVAVADVFFRIIALDVLAREVAAARRGDDGRRGDVFVAAMDEHVGHGEVGIRKHHVVLVRPVVVKEEVAHDVGLAIVEAAEKFFVRAGRGDVERDAEVVLDAAQDVLRDALVLAVLEIGIGRLVRRGERADVRVRGEPGTLVWREDERSALLLLPFGQEVGEVWRDGQHVIGGVVEMVFERSFVRPVEDVVRE